MKKMKRYQEGGSTSVEVEKKSSILDDIGLKGLPLGIMGQGLLGALSKEDLLGGRGGLLGLLMDRKKKREMGMPGTPEDSITKIEIEKSKGVEPMEAMGGGRMGYREGGSLKMVDKGGQKVPFFAADGKGKMAGGGMVGYKKGGRIDGCAIKGKTKGTYR